MKKFLVNKFKSLITRAFNKYVVDNKTLFRPWKENHIHVTSRFTAKDPIEFYEEKIADMLAKHILENKLYRKFEEYDIYNDCMVKRIDIRFLSPL